MVPSFDVHITNIMVKNPDESPKMFIGTIRDVTEQNRMIQTLKEGEVKYRTLTENAPVRDSHLRQVRSDYVP